MMRRGATMGGRHLWAANYGRNYMCQLWPPPMCTHLWATSRPSGRAIGREVTCGQTASREELRGPSRAAFAVPSSARASETDAPPQKVATNQA
eukprot:5158256-Prymnesium_polylepis.1